MIHSLRRMALVGLVMLVAVSFAAVSSMAQTQTAPAAPAQSTEKPADAPKPAKKAAKKSAKPAKKKAAKKSAAKPQSMEKKEEAPAKPKQ